ncbi:MAG: Nitrilase/cyanide hydratase and apolipoprotein N-acyltransferase [Gammaproteobacteria bacterium]|nr:Nitrilase/cyanide hydratase and apolipoprotein N-acyltransferase [Gammaproteobacteria bacterium]
MKVTVCQLHNGRRNFTQDWDRLVEHARAEHSDLVLLPEMPFFPWFPTPREFDSDVWRAAVKAHDEWEKRLTELAPAVVLGTRPIDFGNVRYNAGFAWIDEEGLAATIHVKTCLFNEEGAWETTWYSSALPDFESATVGRASVGMLIGMELWQTDQAKLYGEDGVHFVAVPRVNGVTDDPTASAIDEWLAGGCAAAAASGAYCISSSRGSHDDSAGAAGWIISPDGRSLALTSDDEPIASAEVDLAAVVHSRKR